MGNSNLRDSRVQKLDEFYTRREDIAKELANHADAFIGKTVYCNCDSPDSNFLHYFKDNFKILGLKRLMASCCRKGGRGILSEYDGVTERKVLLPGDGDYGSCECLSLLQECDIVVTNPPFSKMNEYLPMLIASGKQFLILGSLNHLTMRHIAKLFFEQKMFHLGRRFGHFWFSVPDDYEAKGTDYKEDENGRKWRRIGACCWFTNIPDEAERPPLKLAKSVNDGGYARYDGTDIINVDKVDDIPGDYGGVMGVPITYLARHCPSQFSILGVAGPGRFVGACRCFTRIGGRSTFPRVLIQRVS